MIAARELLDYARGKALIGDTGYDSNDLRAEIRHRDIKPVIHSKPERNRARRSTAPCTADGISSRSSSTA